MNVNTRKIIDEVLEIKIPEAEITSTEEELDHIISAARKDTKEFTSKKNFTKKANGKKNKSKKNKQPDFNTPDISDAMKNFDMSSMMGNMKPLMDQMMPMLNEMKPKIMEMVTGVVETKTEPKQESGSTQEQ